VTRNSSWKPAAGPRWRASNRYVPLNCWPRFLLDPYQNPQSGMGVTSQIYALHEDWSMITPSSPAIPGELIRVYMTGLGPVEPRVPTGVPAPARPPSVAAMFGRCELRSNSQISGVEVIFAGLAPGTVGLPGRSQAPCDPHV